jgi:hypothetical protein
MAAEVLLGRNTMAGREKTADVRQSRPAVLTCIWIETSS